MLNDLLKKEGEFVSGIISEYEAAIKDTEKAIANVEEKYKKLAEKETLSLNIELDELKERLDSWKATITKKDDEPKIEDTLYPENNESPCNSSNEPTEEKGQEEEFSDEPATSEPVELDEHPEVTEDWEEETKAEANEDDDDWGEPKDWN